MKNKLTIILLLIVMFGCSHQKTEAPASKNSESAQSSNAIPDSSMGLSKTSVFDTPDPEPVSYSDKFPGTSDKLPRAYLNAPPQIPHNIESFKPIKGDNNTCVGCHHNPSLRGQAIAKGTPTPIPESHYTDLRHKPDTVGKNLVEARYVCTQCHVPQANTSLLVGNEF